jgi:hypothetical protein
VCSTAVSPCRFYAPLTEEPGLFRTFADTPQTPDGILAFANRFGCLGVGQQESGVSLTDPLIRPLIEPLTMWLNLIRWVRGMVGVWEASQGQDLKALATLVEEDAKEFVFVRRWRKPKVGTPTPAGQIRELWEATPEDIEERLICPKADLDYIYPGCCNAAGAARFFLSLYLSIELKGVAAPCLVWDVQKQQAEFRVRPSSLWGAITVQFAQAVAGNKKHRQCPVCGRWFELGQPDSEGRISRSDKLACSPSCRTRGYRVRQERARALHTEGWSPRRIAKELDSDVATVKGWLKKQEG